MTEQGTKPSDLRAHLDRAWNDLKDLTQSLEDETRRGGQIARLRYELHGLRRKRNDQLRRLGELVYAAQQQTPRRPALARVEGYDEQVAELNATSEAIQRRVSAIAALGGDSGRNADAA